MTDPYVWLELAVGAGVVGIAALVIRFGSWLCQVMEREDWE